MSGVAESVLDLKGSVLPTATARKNSLDLLQTSLTVMAYHAFSVSTRLFNAPHVSHSWTKGTPRVGFGHLLSPPMRLIAFWEAT